MDEMAKRGLKNLRKRGGIYYYARRVPTDLVAIFGKEHITPISLRTSDPALAEERWHEQQAYWDDHFKELRRQAMAATAEPSPSLSDAPTSLSRLETIRLARRVGRTHALPSLTQTSVEGLVGLWKSEALARLKLPSLGDEERKEAEINGQMDIDALLAVDDQTRGYIQRTADQLLQRHELGALPGEDLYERLCERLRLAMLDVARYDLARLRGETNPAPPVPETVATPVPHTAMTPGAVMIGTILGEAKEPYWQTLLSDKQSLKDRTKDKIWTGLELAIEFFGATTPLSTLTEDRCREYRDFLRTLPPNFSKIRNGRSLAEVAETARARGRAGLARATREGYFATLRQFLEWAAGKGMIRSNPALRITEGRKVAGDSRKHHSFTPAQLRSIFGAPLFTGCVDDSRGAYTPGPNLYRAGRFWVPLLGLFTGARLGELCQLRAEDIAVSEQGTPFIRIHGEGEGMSVKNENSWRSIPLHPELQRIGFLEFVRERKEAGAGPLFPELLVEGRMAGYRMSKLFGYFLKTVGIKDKGITFHSFRHTFRDALRLARVDIEVAERLGGWSSDRTSSGYGEGHTMDLLMEDLKKASYRDLDLRFLYSKQEINERA